MKVDDDDELEMEEREAQAIRQVRVGKYLSNLRAERNFKLSDLSTVIGVSPSYISDIERGKKQPSDMSIRAIAKFYGVDEIDLFERFGKIPGDVSAALLNNTRLKRTIRQVAATKKLTEDEKQEFYDKVERLYRDFAIEKQLDDD